MTDETKTSIPVHFEEPNEEPKNNVVQHLEQILESGISKVLNAFEQKMAFDAAKQQQIDRLHAELQEYRTDLIAKTNRPLVNGLIHLHDNIGRLIEGLKSKPTEQLEPDRFFKAIGGIQDDIEILLDQNGIAAFTEQDETFQPRRQRALKKVSTTEEELVGRVAEQLKPGFEQGNEIVQKERVSVYVLKTTVQKELSDGDNDKTN
jgi:molecular chaperone GrpE